MYCIFIISYHRLCCCCKWTKYVDFLRNNAFECLILLPLLSSSSSLLSLLLLSILYCCYCYCYFTTTDVMKLKGRFKENGSFTIVHSGLNIVNTLKSLAVCIYPHYAFAVWGTRCVHRRTLTIFIDTARPSNWRLCDLGCDHRLA